jgi:hypothetical protein
MPGTPEYEPEVLAAVERCSVITSVSDITSLDNIKLLELWN